jgi:hypothetical protein
MKSLILAVFAIACAEPRSGAAGAPPDEPPGVVAAAESLRTQPSEGTPNATAAATAAPLDAPPIGKAPDRGDEALVPELIAADGTPLPQTDERPRTDSAGMRLRLEALVDAIAHDDPARAMPAFFPRSSYEQVKAITDPARDWRERLVRAFTRDIHEYHALLGPDAAGAQLASLVVNERAVRWMPPGAEGNRVGYYRVTRSRLRLRLPSGSPRELELTSLISWRGAWFVVHLHGFS